MSSKRRTKRHPEYKVASVAVDEAERGRRYVHPRGVRLLTRRARVLKWAAGHVDNIAKATDAA